MRELEWNELTKAAGQLNNHIRNTEELVNVLKDVKYTLDKLLSSREHEYLSRLRVMEDQISLLQRQLSDGGVANIDVYGYRYEKSKQHFESDAWPLAVNPNFINLPHEMKVERAENIMNLIVQTDVMNSSFLDFGCGDGYIAEEARRMNASDIVGYDTTNSWKFPNADKLLFTTNWDDVLQRAPYNIVLLYDVLDHCDDPIEILHRIKTITTPNAHIYVRNHPWCSRHGGHLYEQSNKAFLHLVFDDIELVRLKGIHKKNIQKITEPLKTYHQWFRQCGYRVEWETITEEPVENFFTSFDNLSIKERIAGHWSSETNPEDHMKISFVDYLLVDDKKSPDIF